jgi:hypothetical protein
MADITPLEFVRNFLESGTPTTSRTFIEAIGQVELDALAIDSTILAGSGVASEDVAFEGQTTAPNNDGTDEDEVLTYVKAFNLYGRPERLVHVSANDAIEALYGAAITGIKDYSGWAPNIDTTVGKEATLLFAKYFAGMEGSNVPTRFDIFDTEVGWRMTRMFTDGIVMRLNIGGDSTNSGEMTLADVGLQVEIRNDLTNGWEGRVNASDGATLILGSWFSFTGTPRLQFINYFRVVTNPSTGAISLFFASNQTATEETVFSVSMPAIIIGDYGSGSQNHAILSIANYAQAGTANNGTISAIYHKY